MKRSFIILVSLIILISGFIFYFQTHRQLKNIQTGASSLLEIGEPAPELELKDMTGNIHRLSEYKGKVILVNFWASWCPPCLIEMPSLASLHHKLKDHGFEILAISLDENEKNVKDFIVSQHPPFSIFLDSEGQSAHTFLVYGLPYSVIVDREGKIRHKIFGGQEWDQGNMFEKIKSLL